MRIKLFTHTDLDGVGCAVLAYLAFGYENVDVEFCSYDNVNQKVLKFIMSRSLSNSAYYGLYITDLSVSEEVARQIEKHKDNIMPRLFDHHATALWLNKYDWCHVMENLPICSYCKTSGTELFYVYLYNFSMFNMRDADTMKNISKFVAIVRDWDTWRWKELGNAGSICNDMNNLFSMYGIVEFIEWVMAKIALNDSDVFPAFGLEEKTMLAQLRKDINHYVDEKNSQIIKKEDIFGNRYGVVFAERYISELGNRLCELNPKLVYIAIIDISEGKISFRTIRDNINLGDEITHAYGGGGHPKAAGALLNPDTVEELINNIFGSPNKI
jgi:oligoribonuclease NrnB/cAMP/cGMP phosphodiesterase (DHH superfamily)